MTTTDLRLWLKATPFQPFRITLDSGRSLVVRHQELVDVFRSSFLLKTPSEEEGILDHAEMIGLVLIESIAPLEASTPHE